MVEDDNPIGEKFTRVEQISISKHRKSLRMAFNDLVSVEDAKAKTTKEDLVAEKLLRLEYEKKFAVSEAENKGHVKVIEAHQEAAVERKQKAADDKATEDDVRSKKHELDKDASETKKIEVYNQKQGMFYLGRTLQRDE